MVTVHLESGEWRVESGEWRVESGEWRVESGEWRVESGEWRVESGEWRVESGEWRVESGHCTLGERGVVTVHLVNHCMSTTDVTNVPILSPFCPNNPHSS